MTDTITYLDFVSRARTRQTLLLSGATRREALTIRRSELQRNIAQVIAFDLLPTNHAPLVNLWIDPAQRPRKWADFLTALRPYGQLSADRTTERLENTQMPLLDPIMQLPIDVTNGIVWLPPVGDFSQHRIFQQDTLREWVGAHGTDPSTSRPLPAPFVDHIFARNIPPTFQNGRPINVPQLFRDVAAAQQGVVPAVFGLPSDRPLAVAQIFKDMGNRFDWLRLGVRSAARPDRYVKIVLVTPALELPSTVVGWNAVLRPVFGDDWVTDSVVQRRGVEDVRQTLDAFSRQQPTPNDAAVLFTLLGDVDPRAERRLEVGDLELKWEETLQNRVVLRATGLRLPHLEKFGWWNRNSHSDDTRQEAARRMWADWYAPSPISMVVSCYYNPLRPESLESRTRYEFSFESLRQVMKIIKFPIRYARFVTTSRLWTLYHARRPDTGFTFADLRQYLPDKEQLPILSSNRNVFMIDPFDPAETLVQKTEDSDQKVKQYRGFFWV